MYIKAATKRPPPRLHKLLLFLAFDGFLQKAVENRSRKTLPTLLQSLGIRLRRRTRTRFLGIPHHLPAGTITPLPHVPARQFARQRARRGAVDRHIAGPQSRLREGFVEVIRVALAEQSVIEDLWLVDEIVEGLCGVERGLGGGEGEIEGFGFDFGARDGVGDYDFFDARGVDGGVRGDGGVGVVVGVEVRDEDCGAAEAADEG